MMLFKFKDVTDVCFMFLSRFRTLSRLFLLVGLGLEIGWIGSEIRGFGKILKIFRMENSIPISIQKKSEINNAFQFRN